MRRFARRVLGLAALAVLGCGACATRATSSPFVKKGGAGFVDLGGSSQVPPPLPSADVARLTREAAAKREAERPPPLPSIEGQDAGVREALAVLAAGTSPAAHLSVAEAYMRVGVRDLAYDHYSAAIRLAPRNVQAFDGRARLWRDVGFLAPALNDAHRARYFDPKSAEVRNTLGTILERQELCQEALASYREALRLKPDAAWAQQNVTRLADKCIKAP